MPFDHDRIDGSHWMIRPDHSVYPISFSQMLEWLGEHGEAAWEANKRVTLDHIDGINISTVFLYLNHRFGPDGPPLIFETMVFGGELDQECERYSTWAEAIAGHEAMVERVRLSLPMPLDLPTYSQEQEP